jgi:hypothetical protein
MQVKVHHNSRQAECTVADDQTGLKPYEIRLSIGVREANILYIDKQTKSLIVHKNNVEFPSNN